MLTFFTADTFTTNMLLFYLILGILGLMLILIALPTLIAREREGKHRKDE